MKLFNKTKLVFHPLYCWIRRGLVTCSYLRVFLPRLRTTRVMSPIDWLTASSPFFSLAQWNNPVAKTNRFGWTYFPQNDLAHQFCFMRVIYLNYVNNTRHICDRCCETLHCRAVNRVHFPQPSLSIIGLRAVNTLKKGISKLASWTLIGTLHPMS